LILIFFSNRIIQNMITLMKVINIQVKAEQLKKETIIFIILIYLNIYIQLNFNKSDTVES